MISRIRGEIIALKVVDKNFSVEVMLSSGVGYKVIVGDRVFRGPQFGEIELFTSFQVREDSQRLYGFLSEEERDMFELVITVSGVGPKIGVAILEQYGVVSLIEIVEESDYKQLMKVSGVGQRTAQKIVLDLQGKLKLPENFELRSGKQRENLRELKEALVTLGFQGGELDGLVVKAEEIIKQHEDMTSEQLLRVVLDSS